MPEFMVDDLMMASGLFWCVYEAHDARAGRMVRAFYGEGAEEKARTLANKLNGKEDV